VQDHGFKFNHQDEDNVLLEFKTGQHFVFLEGGGKAIVDCLIGHIQGYKNCEVHWEREGLHLLTNKNGSVRGLQVRKKDGLLIELTTPNV
jgi:aspartate oxidase